MHLLRRWAGSGILDLAESIRFSLGMGLPVATLVLQPLFCGYRSVSRWLVLTRTPGHSYLRRARAHGLPGSPPSSWGKHQQLECDSTALEPVRELMLGFVIHWPSQTIAFAAGLTSPAAVLLMDTHTFGLHLPASVTLCPCPVPPFPSSWWSAGLMGPSESRSLLCLVGWCFWHSLCQSISLPSQKAQLKEWKIILLFSACMQEKWNLSHFSFCSTAKPKVATFI